ncbi:unnamed protein product, partial [Urochloa humidicola]
TRIAAVGLLVLSFLRIAAFSLLPPPTRRHGRSISTIPALPPHATSSPALSIALVPLTAAAAVGAVPVSGGAAAPAPTPAPIICAAPALALVVDAGVGAVPIVFSAAIAAATHREAIREEARRKKAQHGHNQSQGRWSKLWFSS